MDTGEGRSSKRRQGGISESYLESGRRKEKYLSKRERKKKERERERERGRERRKGKGEVGK